MKTITIASDFSDTPLGRYFTDSDVSGERFREEFLRPALTEHEKVTVDIDGTEGYGSSFLEEAFGGLVRKGYFTPQKLRAKMIIRSVDPDFRLYQKLIWKYVDEAQCVPA